MTRRAAEAQRLREQGIGAFTQGRLDQAVACFAQALQWQPDNAGTCCNLGLALLHLGQAHAAALRFQQALALQPELAEAHNNLGMALLQMGQYEEAVHSFRHVLRLRPELAEAHNNLGMVLVDLGRHDEALDCFQRALQLRPDLAEAHNNLGMVLAERGQCDEARACYERALQLQPDHFGALGNLGNLYKDHGRLPQAIACYHAVLARRPDDARLHSNLLLALHYAAGADPAAILAESRGYAQRHAAPLAGQGPPHAVRPLDRRRLRLGYVSADFREHPVAYFLEPILAAHDHARFEIFCYADVMQPDAVTQRCQQYADHWRALVGLSDAQAAERIRADGIDVLIDLAGHTGGNRLLAFARRPAPVQLSYLGYLGTTGLQVMDYYVTDSHSDPPGLTEAHFQEKLLRVPACAMCYQPGDAPEARAELPARQAGQVTLASLNPLCKLTDEVLDLWSRILAALPGARLLLRRGAEERPRAAAARHGVGPERVLLLGRAASRFDYLRRYRDVDLSLDPFPYNGITTTCDALWMGVPVLTLAGPMSVARYGVRFLRTVGLEELIATSAEDYVQRAVTLAGDLSRLAALRTGLRERMQRSPLMDSVRLTRDLETAYRTVWEQWAEKNR
jgi:predicted O-linked N-acetylglucosamine transferase (SPINDLY family)